MIKRGKAFYKEEWITEMSEYIRNYNYSHVEITTTLEDMLKDHTGRKYALAVNSGCNAIFLCLFLFCEGGEIIFPNWGYPAVPNACKSLNIRMQPVDIKEETLSMNPEEIKKSINKNTKAIIHIGNSGTVGADIEEIRDIAKENNILFIEDAAPSLLQEFKGKIAGTFGDIGIYSFSPTKPVICGEGGVIVTDNEEIYNKLRVCRHMTSSSYGQNFKCYSDDNVYEGSLNFSLSPFLAAYVVPQLKEDNLKEISEHRERVYNSYKQHIDIFGEDGITNRYGNIMYLSNNAEKISEKFNSLGIDHRYKYYPLYKEGLSISQKVFEKIIDLPSSYELTDATIKFICRLINRIENG